MDRREESGEGFDERTHVGHGFDCSTIIYALTPAGRDGRKFVLIRYEAFSEPPIFGVRLVKLGGTGEVHPVRAIGIKKLLS